MKCATCNHELAVGQTGREHFCINRHCPRFMLDIMTGRSVDDPRFAAATMADWDPRKLKGLQRQLGSEDYMDRIAAVRMLSQMMRPGVVDVLVTYLQEESFSSVKPMAAQLLCQVGDVRSVPGLRAARKHLEHLRSMDAGMREYADGLLGDVDAEIQRLTQATGSLIDAVRRNDAAEVQHHLESGADLLRKGAQGESPLHWACQGGFAEIAELLINAGSNLDAADDLGHTPLSLAVYRWHREVITLLVRGGADVKKLASNGAAVLHFAAAEGDAETARLLVNAGAERTARTADGLTPADIAKAQGYMEVVSILDGS
jgi:hypothetical protein